MRSRQTRTWLALALLVGLLVGPSALRAEDALAEPGAWFRTTVADNLGEEFLTTSLALSSAGLPHIAYTRHLAGTGEQATFDLNLAAREMGAWASALVAEGAIWPSLALDASGAPHLAYHQRSDQGLFYATQAGASWGREAVASPAWAPSLALDASDTPHIAFTQDGPSVSYALRDEGAWQTDPVRSPAGGPSLALDQAGAPHLAFCGFGPHQGVWYARWSAEQGWEYEQVDTGTCDGIRLALGPAGAPHIAYAPSDAQDPADYPGVWYAMWDGAAWQREHVSSQAGAFDLAVDGADRPHLAYFEADGPATEGLRYARRLASGWAAEAVDRSRAGGVSLAVDGLGNPHIAYYDLNEGTLHYAQRLARRVYLPLIHGAPTP